MRYELKAFVLVDADSPEQARGRAEELCVSNPEGAEVYLEESSPEVVEDD